MKGKIHIKTAIFLGAGASAAAGAPVQNELFREYFQSIRQHSNYLKYQRVRELGAYFQQIFGLDVLHGDLNNMQFPTFEEAIGILDLAVRRREAFKSFDLENIDQDSNRIGYIRQYLVLLMAEVLERNIDTSCGLYQMLLSNLRLSDLLSRTLFITTNYDILIDHALAAASGIAVNYGVKFTNRHIEDIMVSKKADVVSIYKLHGSLNWLYCPTCSTLQFIRYGQGIAGLLTNPKLSICSQCGTVQSPPIVPPTFYKDMSNIFLSTVWHKAEEELREVSHVIFCGYSFPDADMHVKYLLKRAQTNRNTELAVTVINGHTNKQAEAAAKEKSRYERFLGSCVNYTHKSFQEFAVCPQPYF